MKTIRTFILATITLGIYVGCALLTLILYLGLIGLITDNWVLWNGALANPHVITISIVSLSCLGCYLLYLVFTMIRPYKPDKQKSKQSKNIYHPKE